MCCIQIHIIKILHNYPYPVGHKIYNSPVSIIMFTKRYRKDNSVCINNAFLLVHLGVLLEINLLILVEPCLLITIIQTKFATPCRMEKNPHKTITTCTGIWPFINNSHILSQKLQSQFIKNIVIFVDTCYCLLKIILYTQFA